MKLAGTPWMKMKLQGEIYGCNAFFLCADDFLDLLRIKSRPRLVRLEIFDERMPGSVPLILEHSEQWGYMVGRIREGASYALTRETRLWINGRNRRLPKSKRLQRDRPTRIYVVAHTRA